MARFVAFPRQSEAGVGSYARIACLAAIAAIGTLAWVLTAGRMASMDAGPGTPLGALGWFIVGWTLMMIAMMLPSLAPVAVESAALRSGNEQLRLYLGLGTFLAGFLVPWVGFGLAAFGIIDLVRSLDLGVLAWSEGGRYVAAGVILAAALYELTPAKAAFLRRCRDPDSSMWVSHSGLLGTLEAGIANGVFCVGCCWALMAALFALGVMSLTWMIVVAVLIAADKLLPRTRPAGIVVALTLAIVGFGVAAAPDRVPGLTVPGSSSATRAMDRMEMPKPMDRMDQPRQTGPMKH